MWQYHDRIVTNSLLFMGEAIADLRSSEETDPELEEKKFLQNKAVVLASTSIENLLKSMILDHCWQEVFVKPKFADKKLIKTGEMKSKGLWDCVEYLQDVKLLKKGDGNTCKNLAKQRNKIVHIGYNVRTNSAHSQVERAAEFLVRQVNQDKELAELYDEQLQEIINWMEC